MSQEKKVRFFIRFNIRPSAVYSAAAAAALKGRPHRYLNKAMKNNARKEQKCS